MNRIEAVISVALVMILFVVYVVKADVFRSLTKILERQRSTEPLGISLEKHYRAIYHQSVLLALLLAYFAARSLGLIPRLFWISIPLYVICAVMGIQVVLSGRRLLRFARHHGVMT